MFYRFWKPKEAPLDYAPAELSSLETLNRALDRLGAPRVQGGDEIETGLAAALNAIADRLDALETRNGWTDA